MTRPEVKPYHKNNMSKKSEVAMMFDKIAHRYDFLNHFLSLNIDKIWRKKAVKKLQHSKPQTVLDIACGTGDLALTVSKRVGSEKITGIDISQKMLEYGNKKIEKAGLSDRIHLQYGDSENIEFENDSFDAVTAAFGVRNFQNLEKGISEMYRVLKPGGKLVILEFSQPQAFPIKPLYRFYFLKILPFIGKLFSKDRSAYSYLPESVLAFPYGEQFVSILLNVGFKDAEIQSLALGIASIYSAEKN
ncbi:MAG: bifunctional demethylmenaquinone methyltransferase/2-methoxy-6-polyprenyl-1,4-benzoquinol methylase UbiE, partial [Bacteroidota bacterium]|nr:bifunctional demethylmenaquinone methyltransferase/2-methoxy-6-polyprenyl-1,4-benzoquinol methylase UbiE [Bacteroidota bacterium]